MTKTMEDWDLKLTSRILIANRFRRFMSCVTRGERGYGKSMYNLKAMALAFYRLFEYNEKKAWEMALSKIIFSPFDYMKRIEYNFEQGIIDPIWCLDDAGVHFTGMMFFRSPALYALVNGSFDTLRTVTNGLLINCPYKNKLMEGLKQYDDREVTLYIGKEGSYNRKAVCIKWYRLPSGKREWYKDFEDEFSCYVPKWIYEKYLEKRRKYNKEISDEWKEKIETIKTRH